MVRSSLLLHPQREPVKTRPAATVLLLRDTPQGLEVLMTRRSATASFAPGAYVFPGGGIDAADAQAHGLALARPTQAASALTPALAAIRESFEELGILLARRADGRPVDADTMARLDRRADAAGFYATCAREGLRLCADQVYLLAHWITDRDLPRRFDVPFMVAPMPPGQQPVADETEQFEPVWVRPAEALERHRAGSFFMIFPTIRTLERLAAYADVSSVLQACAGEQALWTSCPRAGWLGGRELRCMEHDMQFGELALTSPDGQIVHHLDWRHDQPVALLRHVRRLTAGNPSMMTGPGTNAYLVGTDASGYIVIDPGPDLSEHVQRLFDATGGRIRAIVCTHSHADHAPAARPLQALCRAAGQGEVPVLGLASAPTARASSRFVPDRELADGERLVIEGGANEALAPRITLRVVHTPGHAANHLCLVLEEDGLLFSGDHILNGSTTVIDPPDGSMNAYLASLDRLAGICEREGVDFILPAHGWVLGFAAQAIAQLKAHRLRREAKVLAALRQRPGASLDELLPLAYDDTPQPLWPVAMRSLTAHVERLRELGQA